MSQTSQPRPRRPLALDVLTDVSILYRGLINADRLTSDADKAKALTMLAGVAASHLPVVKGVALAIEKAAETAVPSTLGPWGRVPALKPVPEYVPANDHEKPSEQPGPFVA